MKKRTFLKLSSAIITTAAIAPLESCQNKPTRTNWAGNIRYLSDNLHEPENIEELKKLIRNTDRIKGQGTSHSFNGIDNSTFGFVRVTRLNKVLSLDETNMTVTVQSGIRYGELCKHLESKGFALHNLASLPHISVGGSIATATHGSGDKNGNLSTAVKGLKIVNAAGEEIELKGDEANAAIVHLGALGIVTEVTLAIQPTFQVRQYVYQYLAMAQLKDHFDEIFSSGYSVSLFTDWSKDTINQVWVKKRVTPEDPADAPAELFGAKAATKDLHPIEAISAVNCTPQMGVAGPWHERLPHFKLDFTPSAGEELQAEYFVPRANAYEAIAAVYDLRRYVNPLIQISEVRSIASDNLLMSPCSRQNLPAGSQGSIAIHFTWKKDWEGVQKVLPMIEKALAPYNVRPHWGKLFTIEPSVLRSRYKGLDDFKKLVKDFDPHGKFVNEFLERNLLA